MAKNIASIAKTTAMSLRPPGKPMGCGPVVRAVSKVEVHDKNKDVIFTCEALCEIHIYRVIKSVQHPPAPKPINQSHRPTHRHFMPQGRSQEIWVWCPHWTTEWDMGNSFFSACLIVWFHHHHHLVIQGVHLTYLRHALIFVFLLRHQVAQGWPWFHSAA